ncbi:hypothetical protein RJ640_011465 [Escallonia rubra]|uniref:Protein kinase domain-containing protein n=1 Tax=Escallonia rubra TaxID=112253 RepID=A0AA88UMF9_9ASTE|nr:hypothetical protein RJ640_011465 [Escallonia rubra]
MQVADPSVPVPPNADPPTEPDTDEPPLNPTAAASHDSITDISGQILDFPVANVAPGAAEALYIYKNVFNLIPRSVSVGTGRLKTLKFFANEINLFPAEFRDLVDLESVQVKVSTPGLTGLLLHKLKSLRELELSKVPPRPSAFPILSEIAGLKCLTRLSVCHFSIRYLPPEIGCLNNLEHLDLSFNKMRTLPTEITYLIALISLKVTNNKLVKLPSGLSSLHRLENLDLSNNRLMSVGSLELGSMHNLRRLNLQCNKLPSCSEIPSWISCSLEGNGKDAPDGDFASSSVEMDVLESSIQEIQDSPRNGPPITSPSHISGSSSNSRCFATRRSGKGWKRRYYLQQRARQERLNSSRKVLTKNAAERCSPCKHTVLSSDNPTESSSGIAGPDFDDKELLDGEVDVDNSLINVKDDDAGNCSCIAPQSFKRCDDDKNDCGEHVAPLDSLSNATNVQDESSSLEVSNGNTKSKRHPEGDLDNPKPSKTRKPTDGFLDLSSKYSVISFCSIDDRLPDGFYDAGRDRPFLPLRSYEQNLLLDSREVILVDRETDEELDALALCAQALVLRFKQINGSNKGRGQVVDNLQISSLLALFVSDHFGGSDRTATIERTRKAVSGSNYRKPFVCTCATGNSDSMRKSTKQNFDTVEDVVFLDLCEKSLQSIKARRNSSIVPIGTLQFGVCRHRALLLKYLCDRMEPRVPCELVRGYLDFAPHAWNVIVVKRGDSWVRMIVDACRPLDIREETDPEYFCRYVPLSRINISPMMDTEPGTSSSFPSLSACDEIEKVASSTLVQCKFGALEAAAKVHTLEVFGTSTSVDEIKKFEFNCLGEVRILSALKHSCIVEIYGHQISSRWALSVDGNPDRRILQSAILMEYIKGGSLKKYIETLSRAGEKHVPVELALYIARDVSSALVELHSKDIIHRDIKSENILIDQDSKRADGTPVVKLCDFDRAIPLRSSLHTCCIAHYGIPSPDICVGTPRWMAPEVLRTLHEKKLYGTLVPDVGIVYIRGKEVDIWSFGCLLLEMLTLQVPYAGLPESEIHDLLKMGKRPQLTDELEASRPLEDPAMVSGTELEGPEAESETRKFLVNLYRQCTEENPNNRPTAEHLYNLLLTRTSSITL